MHDVACYHTAPAAPSTNVESMLSHGEIDMVTFASSSTVANLLNALKSGKPLLDKVKIACIGPKTAEAAAGAGLKVDIVARKNTIPGLVSAIEDYYTREV